MDILARRAVERYLSNFHGSLKIFVGWKIILYNSCSLSKRKNSEVEEKTKKRTKMVRNREGQHGLKMMNLRETGEIFILHKF